MTTGHLKLYLEEVLFYNYFVDNNNFYDNINDTHSNSFISQQEQFKSPSIQSSEYKPPQKVKPSSSPDLESFNPNQISFNQNPYSSNKSLVKPYSQPQLQPSPHPPIKYYNDSQPMEVLNSIDSSVNQSIYNQQPIIQEEYLPPDERPIKPMKQIIDTSFQQQQLPLQPISPLVCNTNNDNNFDDDYPPRRSQNPSPSPGKKFLFSHQSPKKSQSPYTTPPPNKGFLFHNNNNNNRIIKTPIIPDDEEIEPQLTYTFDRPLHLADSSKYPPKPSPPLHENEYHSPIQSPPVYENINEPIQEYHSPIQSPTPLQSPPPESQPSPLPLQQQLPPRSPPQPELQHLSPFDQYSPFEEFSPPQQISPLQVKQNQAPLPLQPSLYQDNDDKIQPILGENEIKPIVENSEKKIKKKKKKTKSPTKPQQINKVRSALEEERKKMKVVLAIQSLYRMRKIRKKYKDIIQRKVKKTKKINLKKRKKAAIIIQRAYRRHLQLLYEAIIRERKRHVRCSNCGSTEANGLYCKKCGYRIKQNKNKKEINNKSKVKSKVNTTKQNTKLPQIKVPTKSVKDRKNNKSPIQVPKAFKALRSEVKSYKKKF